MKGGPRLRPGAALVELAAALLMGALLLGLLTALVRAQFRVGTRVNARAVAAEVERTAAVVLMAELRGLAVDTDVPGPVGDSMALRAFRGAAVVCEVAAGAAVARFRGSRAPDLTKDSVLVLRDGAEVAWLPGSAGGASHACVSAEEAGVRLVPGDSLLPGDLLLFFERGSYHLSDAALRYRRGAGGRQPLTQELVLPGSGFQRTPGPGGGVAATVRVRTPDGRDTSVLELTVPPPREAP